MSIWAGIKTFLNTTAGTKNFTPLNEIMENQFRIEADENLYARVFDKSAKEYTVETTTQGEWINLDIPDKLKMLKEGTITLNGKLSRNSTARASSAIGIYKNGERIFYHSDTYNESATAFSVTIPVSVYDVLTFRLSVYYTKNATEGKETSATLDYLDMYGSINPNVFHTIIG